MMPKISDEHLAALRAWREAGGSMGNPEDPKEATRQWPAAARALDGILADNPAPEPPWEPSEQAITDYMDAEDCARVFARTSLVRARSRGWDARPRRLVQEFTDEQAAAFSRAILNGVGLYDTDVQRGHTF